MLGQILSETRQGSPRTLRAREFTPKSRAQGWRSPSGISYRALPGEGSPGSESLGKRHCLCGLAAFICPAWMLVGGAGETGGVAAGEETLVPRGLATSRASRGERLVPRPPPRNLPHPQPSWRRRAGRPAGPPPLRAAAGGPVPSDMLAYRAGAGVHLPALESVCKNPSASPAPDRRHPYAIGWWALSPGYIGRQQLSCPVTGGLLTGGRGLSLTPLSQILPSVHPSRPPPCPVSPKPSTSPFTQQNVLESDWSSSSAESVQVVVCKSLTDGISCLKLLQYHP